MQHPPPVHCHAPTITGTVKLSASDTVSRPGAGDRAGGYFKATPSLSIHPG